MNTIVIAIPLAEGRLTNHFGHCSSFAVIKADGDAKTILSKEEIVPPPHEPGLLPRWLGEKGAQVIIAGGMGGRAQELFAQRSIKVVIGAPCLAPEELALRYLAGTLQTGSNACDH